MASTTDADLVRAAGAGDRQAWDTLVERYGGLVWSVARAHRLNAADAADVSQTAWLRLVESLDRIRDPARIGAWLATTARNECLRVIRRSGRQVPTDLEVDDEPPAAETAPVDAGILAGERDHALWRAFATLTERCQVLLRMLIADPPPTYEEVSAALGMPIGSIGPVRGRCLEQLRRKSGISGLLDGSGSWGG